MQVIMSAVGSVKHAPSSTEATTIERATTRVGTPPSRDGTRWKTALRVVLIIALIAATIVIGKVVVPKVISFITKAASVVGSVVSATSEVVETAGVAYEHTAQSVKNTVSFLDTALNKPIAATVVEAVENWVVNDGPQIVTQVAPVEEPWKINSVSNFIKIFSGPGGK